MASPATSEAPHIGGPTSSDSAQRSLQFSLWRGAAKRYPQLCIGGLLLVVLVGSAVLAPILAAYPPSRTDPSASLQGPSAAHPFGTDKLGRDVLSRVLYGGRVSLFVSFAAVFASMVVGVTLGLVSGYSGGWVDSVIMRVMDGLMAFPGLILALTISFALKPSLSSVVIALAAVRIPGFARLVRGQVLALRMLEFVVAAEVIGVTPLRAVTRHLLPNLVSVILVQASVTAGSVIFAEASLGFLGLSVPPPTPTWGGMLHDGYVYLERNPWLSIIPGTVIFLAVLSFNFVGDGLRDVLDPQQRQRRAG